MQCGATIGLFVQQGDSTRFENYFSNFAIY